MNEVCQQFKSFTTSNEAYTYKQMLNENYFKGFFQAVLEEIEVHEKRDQWTLMKRKDITPGSKSIMLFGHSFKTASMRKSKQTQSQTM